MPIDFAKLADLDQAALKAALIDTKLADLLALLKKEDAEQVQLRAQLELRERGYARALGEYRRRNDAARQKRLERERQEQTAKAPRDTQAQTAKAREAAAAKRGEKRASAAMMVMFQQLVMMGAPTFILDLELEAEAMAKVAAWGMAHADKLPTLNRSLINTIIKTPLK